MSRRQWLRELQRGRFPTGQRIMRGTLLCLPMTTAGGIVATDTDIAWDTGLPRRTVSRHLAAAVDSGWLVKGSRGGTGGRVRFRAAVPTVEPVSQKWPTPVPSECATSGQTSEPETTHSRAIGVRHLVADINKTRASDSERVAVNDDRDRRTGHDHSRVSPDHDETKDGSDDELTAHSPIAAISPTTIKRRRSA